MEKVGRNDPCSCGSGLKVKKCSCTRSVPKKLNASILSPDRVSKISSLFPQRSQAPSEVASS